MSIDKPLTTFRGSLAMGISSEVQPAEAGGRFKAGVIPGIAIATRGEALGHGMWLDTPFIDSVRSSMKEDKRGLKVRFTHPDMSSDGLAKGLGRSFFTESDSDDIARGDLHLWQSSRRSPDGDLGGHVLQRASEDPTSFGASIVFMRDIDAEIEFALEHGAEMLEVEDDWGGSAEVIDYKNFRSPDPLNTSNLPHTRLGELRGVDIVDDPAANPDGLFGRDKTFSEVESLVDYALGFSDKKPELVALGVDPDRAGSFFRKYLKTKGVEMTKKPEDENKDEALEPVAEEVKTEPVANESEVSEPDEVVVVAASDEDPREELGRFMKAFGAANGAKWYQEGVSFGDASIKHIEQLKSENESLKKQLSAADESESSPVSTGEISPSKRTGFGSRIQLANSRSNN